MKVCKQFLGGVIAIHCIVLLCSGFLCGQGDTLLFCNFENSAVITDSNNYKHILTNGVEITEMLPHSFSRETFSTASPYSYKSIEYGNYAVGKSFLHHSPTWYPENLNDFAYNHLQIKLSKPLLPNHLYKVSFLIGNFKSHRFKLSHYGIKFSKSIIVKHEPGELLDKPNILFSFKDDYGFTPVLAVIFTTDTCNYLYFGAFKEDPTIIPKSHSKFNSYSANGANESKIVMQDSNLTRVIIDNILIENSDYVVTKYDNLYFDFNDYSVHSKANLQLLDDISKYLKSNPGLSVLLEGYTDTIGTVVYNLELSEKRAEEIKKILITKGIEDNRIITIGQGISNKDIKDPKYARKVSFTFID